MLGKFQSDRIEGEFGVYRQRTAGNYFTSVDQVLNELRLQKAIIIQDRIIQINK